MAARSLTPRFGGRVTSQLTCLNDLERKFGRGLTSVRDVDSVARELCPLPARSSLVTHKTHGKQRKSAEWTSPARRFPPKLIHEL
ncbi:unnamed protein product [Danaus chrysippus]|uniref:(African queen) hypothetical protein n=1 Tax=Danaus chrysippus TaxID=151541 RepID=A0A8J2QRL9_9NEOP|nr:unnamed protein product [Danaus chrysippus]